MFRKSLLAVFGLVLALAFVTPEKAHAGVAFGVTIGGPVVVRPAYPDAYRYAYAPPIVYPPAYVYPRPYAYGPALYGRVYGRPYWNHERFERREYFEHRGHYGRDRR
jgi:hypothetical protein